MSGSEAAETGFANRAFPAAELEARVLEIAERVAKIPSDLQRLNKRSVHRAMEIMGARAAMRSGTEIQALGFHQASSRDYLKKRVTRGVKQALSERDQSFGDYRTRDRGEGSWGPARD